MRNMVCIFERKHCYLKRLFDKFYEGPIVRITPDELHINDPNFSDEIYPGFHKLTEKPRSAAEQFGK